MSEVLCYVSEGSLAVLLSRPCPQYGAEAGVVLCYVELCLTMTNSLMVLGHWSLIILDLTITLPSNTQPKLPGAHCTKIPPKQAIYDIH